MEDVPQHESDPDRHMLMHGPLPTHGVAADLSQSASGGSAGAAESQDSLSAALSQASADLDNETNELRKMMAAFELSNGEASTAPSSAKSSSSNANKAKPKGLSNRIRFVHSK